MQDKKLTSKNTSSCKNFTFVLFLLIGLFVFLFWKKKSFDLQLHGEEVVNMMRVVVWCLQNDFTKRPSMSMVVKVFEGVLNVELDLDYFFSNPHLLNTKAGVDNQE
ncbi:hypothetical protein CFP56_004842, partial [Quercus suber]